MSTTETKIKLTRICAGLYKYTRSDGKTYTIEQGDDPSSSWYREWIVRSDRDPFDYSDPKWTLRECRDWLAESESQIASA